MNDYPIFTVDAASSVAKYNGYTLYHEETSSTVVYGDEYPEGTFYYAGPGHGGGSND